MYLNIKDVPGNAREAACDIFCTGISILEIFRYSISIWRLFIEWQEICSEKRVCFEFWGLDV